MSSVLAVVAFGSFVAAFSVCAWFIPRNDLGSKVAFALGSMVLVPTLVASLLIAYSEQRFYLLSRFFSVPIGAAFLAYGAAVWAWLKFRHGQPRT